MILALERFCSNAVYDVEYFGACGTAIVRQPCVATSRCCLPCYHGLRSYDVCASVVCGRLAHDSSKSRPRIEDHSSTIRHLSVDYSSIADHHPSIARLIFGCSSANRRVCRRIADAH